MLRRSKGLARIGAGLKRSRMRESRIARERRDLEREVLAASAKVVIARARGRCERCGARCMGRERCLEVHHLVPRSRARGCAWIHDVRNLAALCRACHGAIHAHLVADWRRWLWRREDFERQLGRPKWQPPPGAGSFPAASLARVTRRAGSDSCQGASNLAPPPRLQDAR